MYVDVYFSQKKISNYLRASLTDKQYCRIGFFSKDITDFMRQICILRVCITANARIYSEIFARCFYALDIFLYGGMAYI